MKLTTFSTAKKTKSETKPSCDSESKVNWDIFQNFAYVRSYLHLKIFHGSEVVQYLQNEKKPQSWISPF